jgi:hypothetical protein
MELMTFEEFSARVDRDFVAWVQACRTKGKTAREDAKNELMSTINLWTIGLPTRKEQAKMVVDSLTRRHYGE